MHEILKKYSNKKPQKAIHKINLRYFFVKRIKKVIEQKINYRIVLTFFVCFNEVETNLHF